MRSREIVSQHTGKAQDSSLPRVSLRNLASRIGLLFPRNARSEAVETALHLDATPEEVWRGILFYEEVPRRPVWFLRVFLPRPIRTDGEKMRVGAIVRCTYDGGHLLKRITAVEPAHRVRFDVLEQRLGVEDCVSMSQGSYEIRATGDHSEVVLTTHYRGRLRPRRLWRQLERRLAHRLHRHILDGMRATLAVGAAEPHVERGSSWATWKHRRWGH
jgi:hypothetical protein